MKMRGALAALLALAVGGTAGCATKRTDAEQRAKQRADVVRDEVPTAWDSLDGVMRYQVSRVDMTSSKIVLVPVEVAEQEIEPQAGQELELSFDDFRRLAGQEDPSLGDVIQSVEEGGEVIVHGKQLGPPTEVGDIERIELPKDEE